MKQRSIIIAAAAILCASACTRSGYRYEDLPLGAIHPEGWLLEQLQRQADGLTGHLDEVYPEVMGPSNAWLGGDGDAWERGPYWIDGLLPLGWILDDPALKEKAQVWVEAILGSQREDGNIGPAEDHPFVYGLQRGASQDWWPRMVALKILRQYYMATEDRRVIDCLDRYFRYQLKTLPEKPLDHWSSWGMERGADNLEVVYWLYGLTGEKYLLRLGDLLWEQTRDWTELFISGPEFFTPNSLHCVNLGEALKAPAVRSMYGDGAYKLAALEVRDRMRHGIGLPTGLWAGDEKIHFGDPTRGTELCTIVETMFSLEESLRITGVTEYADWLERVAYNALPAQVTDDYCAKQYFSQVNQISCKRDDRPFSTPHYGTDVLFGTLNGYPCCLSNMHQGWPKFVQNLWYRTKEGGYAALVYGPSRLETEDFSIREETDYPFGNSVTFTVGKASGKTFPLEFRCPSWSGTMTVSLNGKEVHKASGGAVARISRGWEKGDVITLCFEREVEVERWYDDAAVITYGPLLFSLKMEEKWEGKTFLEGEWYFGKEYREVTSDAPWNYCLIGDKLGVNDFEIRTNDGVKGYPWNVENAPLSLFAKARRLPSWVEVCGNTGPVAFFTEDGVDFTQEEEVIELIPYGCTTLRITEFPVRTEPWDIDLRLAQSPSMP